ncbi:hypothetical protein [Nonomuraea sp. NPDC005650]|uniref:hypothetical protein n=1 Tax=Nonomuraea sp. NPDC005650 TaxID=3157045 RepID=UPI0033B5D162
MTDQGRSEGPPGRPLWLAAEQQRAKEGVSKFDWVAQIGIGRRSYDRLAIQENKPITRTVKKVAARIRMSYEDAMRLANLTPPDAQADSAVDVVVQGRAGVIRMRGRAGEIHVQVKHFQRPLAEQQLDALREAGEETGRTLGEVLVLTGLAEPEELKVTRDSAGVDSSTAIGGEDAETAQSRRGPST